MDKDLVKRDAEEALFAEPTEEQFQKEFQEILRKRELYQKQQEKALQEIHEEKKRVQRKRISSAVKVAVVVLVAGTCFVTWSMRSEATKLWWLKMTDRDINGENEEVVNNDDNRIVVNMTEYEAVADIEAKTGIPMPELFYKSEGMIYDSYKVGETNSWGFIHYLYNEYIVTLKCYTAEVDASYSRSYDGDLLKKQVVETVYGTVTVQEIKSISDEVPTCIATWTYKNHAYILEGKLPFEEILKIIENIFF